MRIGIDARRENIIYGMTRYTTLFLDGLTYLSRHRFFLFSPQRVHRTGAHWRRVPCPWEGQRIGSLNHLIAYEQVLLPKAIEKQKIAVFHSPVHPLPGELPAGCRSIATVHDLVPWTDIDVDNKASRLFARYTRRWMAVSCKKATIISVVSEHTRKNLVRILGVPSKKIQVIYPYIDPSFTAENTDAQIANIIRGRGIRQPYILTANVSRAYKNTVCLLEAYRSLRGARKIDHQLVLAGNYAENYPLKKWLRRYSSTDIICTGYLPERTLRALYTGADAFVYPSLSEGFGYPPLEAMACGTPVLAARAGSLPEVLGNAGVFFDAKNPWDLAEKLLNVLRSSSMRVTLRARGFRQARSFSRARFVTALQHLYEKLAD